MKSFILAVDQSTSGTKSLLVNEQAEVEMILSVPHKQIYPQPGWVEHDPEEILQRADDVIHQMVEKSVISNSSLQALALTNQRETVVVWDRDSGRPIYNAIVWQDRRTASDCEKGKKEGWEEIIRSKTGLTLDPYFSATKVKWILDHVEGARSRADSGKLLMGTIDSWLIWNWTDGKVHATDYTNASRTLLFNIHTLQWDDELLSLFNIPRSMLPEVKFSDYRFGDYDIKLQDRHHLSIPISAVIGDSQAALFAQKCWSPGMVKATYGTGTSLLMNTGNEVVKPENGLVSAIAWGANGKIDYALEGIIHSSGDTVKWVRDKLRAFQDFREAEKMIAALPVNEGVYLIPAFVGLGAPYWDPNARAAIVGMNRDTGLPHIVRAAIESMAYQVKDVVNLMQDSAGITIDKLRADGGAVDNRFLMQFQSDLLRVPVISSKTKELSAMGAVYLAGMAAGIWRSQEEIVRLDMDVEHYVPRTPQNRMDERYASWKDAVSRVIRK